jgi:hypothetical protein
LFSAVQVDKKDLGDPNMFSKNHMFLIGKTIEHGFVFDPQYAHQISTATLDQAIQIFGKSGEMANATFHKGWEKVADAPMAQLWAEQATHYLTTYGYEHMGIYSEERVYIPVEQLDIPGLTDEFSLRVIRYLTKEEVLKEIKKLTHTSVALHERTLKDLLAIVQENEYGPEILKGMKNKEFRAMLSDLYDVVPSDPTQYLRYLISKITGNSLLIKNPATFRAIVEQQDSQLHQRTLDSLLREAPKDLSSVFHRYKMLFLALKKVSVNKSFFNTLSKEAKKLTPRPQKLTFKDVTACIKRGDLLGVKAILEQDLPERTIFQKMGLAKALKVRTRDLDSIVYQVRNGKSFTKPFNFRDRNVAEGVLIDVIRLIAKDLEHLKGKTFLVDEGVKIAMPTSEKQFIGPIPTGTSVYTGENLVTGIYWKNHNGRVDLDLSGISVKGKVGWDGAYRAGRFGESDTLFSGDITDAPNGATELLYMKHNSDDSYLVNVNFYNKFDKAMPMPMKLLVATDEVKSSTGRFPSRYVVDPNKIVASLDVELEFKETIVGLTVGPEFFFVNSSNRGGRSAKNSEISQQSLHFFKVSMTNGIYLNDILLNELGCTLVYNEADLKDEKGEVKEHIDLRLDSLNKTTIIDLLTNSESVL